MTGILRYEELANLLGYDTPGKVESCLRKQGIHVFYGKGGAPWTTIELINRAGGCLPANGEREHYGTEICRSV